MGCKFCYVRYGYCQAVCSRLWHFASIAPHIAGPSTGIRRGHSCPQTETLHIRFAVWVCGAPPWGPRTKKRHLRAINWESLTSYSYYSPRFQITRCPNMQDQQRTSRRWSAMCRGISPSASLWVFQGEDNTVMNFIF